MVHDIQLINLALELTFSFFISLQAETSGFHERYVYYMNIQDVEYNSTIEL